MSYKKSEGPIGPLAVRVRVLFCFDLFFGFCFKYPKLISLVSG